MSDSDERLLSPNKSSSYCSPSEKYVSSEKDEESRSTVHHDEDLDTAETAYRENTTDIGENANIDDDLARHDDEYFRPIKRLRMVNLGEERPPSPPKPLTSFLIKDILSHKPSGPRRHSVSSERNIVRPWDLGSPANLTTTSRRPRSADDDSQSDKSESDSSTSPAGVVHNSSPLDALFEMTSKAFEGLDADEKSTGKSDQCISFYFFHWMSGWFTLLLGS